jgi:hypothetical protein
MASNTRRKSTMKSLIFVTAVSMTPLWQKRSLVKPHILCVKVIGMVQDNLPIYVYSIDIPIKDSQSLSNMRSKVSAVSYLRSGVIDTDVQVTAMSITPLCMSKRCHWHRCTCHSSVNDTAVPCAAESDFLIKSSVELCAKIFEKIWLHSGVIDTAVHITAVSLTLLCKQLCR